MTSETWLGLRVLLQSESILITMLIRNDKDVQSKPLIRHVHDFVSSFVFYINIPDNCLKNQYLLKSPFAC